jgi:hypothetical protein
MKDISLTLTIDEANLVLEALGTLPFTRVFTLIAKIQEQATQQLRDDTPAPAAHVPDIQPLAMKR